MGSRATDQPADLGPENRWAVLAVLCAALLVIVIDVTVLHIAAPAIAEDLRPSATSLLWIIDVYPLVVAPLLVTGGTLGDRFGRKRMLLTGLIVFCAASAAAAFAWSPGSLIAARAAQGLGGALIMPSTMSIIRVVFPDRHERVRAVGIWSAVLAGGAAAGPLVGGFLVEHFWWGSVFLINVPVLLLVLPFALRILPESRHSSPPPWDTLGVVLVAAGILLLVFGIKHAARHTLGDPWALAAILGSPVLLTLFVRRQLRRPRPLLDVRLFTQPVFAVAVAAVALVLFALVGLEFFFAQYLQLVLGLGPFDASVRLVPLLISTLIGALLAAPLLRRLGTRTVLAGGLGLSAISLVPLLALGTADQYWLLIGPFLVMGAALEAALVAANDTILSSVTVDGAGQASSIEETAYELGGGIGIAVLGAIGAAIFTASISVVPGIAPAQRRTAEVSITEAVAVAQQLPERLATPLLAAARDAFVSGLHVVVLISFVLIAVSAIAVALIVPRRGVDGH